MTDEEIRFLNKLYWWWFYNVLPVEAEDLIMFPSKNYPLPNIALTII